MEMVIEFSGGAKVDAHFGKFTVQTDQSIQSGGEDTAPSPFNVFLASIGTCAGIYVLGFCKQRGLPTEGIRIIEKINRNHMTSLVEEITLEIQVPPEFPEKYYDALIRSAEQCAVKKSIENPPKFKTYTKIRQSQQKNM